jgi:excisionase family DNA binding protein
MTDPKWYTIKEAAKYLSIGEPTLYRWMRDGKITVRKIGDSTRFLQEDLDAFVKVIPSDKNLGELRRRCPSCKNETLVKGSLQSTGKNYFTPEKSKFWTFKDSNVATQALMCSHCGSISLFGDTQKLATLRTDAED